MNYLIPGLLIFICNHSIRLLAPGWRERFIQNYGANTWKMIYSLFSLLGLALIIYGYQQTRLYPVFVWTPPEALRHLALLLTWLAFVLFAAASIKGNHFKARLGHPMYAGVKLWALAHLLANGRLGDIVLFTVFLVWAITGFSISRRRDRSAGLTYGEASGRSTAITLVAGSAGWALFAFLLHAMLIGVSPLP